MTDLPEAGRQAAHTLIDVVSLWDDAPDTELMNRAFARLNHIGAIRAHGSPQDQTLEVDISALMGGTTVMLKWLVSRLAGARGIDEAEIIAELREFIGPGPSR